MATWLPCKTAYESIANNYSGVHNQELTLAAHVHNEEHQHALPCSTGVYKHWTRLLE